MKHIILIAALLSSSIISSAAYAKVTIEDGYKSEADYYKSVKDNQAEYEKTLYSGLEDPQNANVENTLKWKTLYSGNTVSPITIPSGVANLYVTTTTGQSYFIPVVAPPINFAKLQVGGIDYVYARWTGHQIKGQSKTVRVPHVHSASRHMPAWTTYKTFTQRIGITRIMTQ